MNKSRTFNQFSIKLYQNMARVICSYKLHFSIFMIVILCTCNVFAMNEKVGKESSLFSKKDDFTQAINSCPGGIAFGIYSINFEKLFWKNHGLVFRYDYENIPKNYTEADLEASGVAFILNYRWHLSENINSKYVGIYTRYRVYSGKGTLESTEFNFKIPEVTLGLNVGKRWVWNNGFNLNLAFGYGFFLTKTKDSDPSTPAIKPILNKFEDSYDFIDPFLGEFSIGYTF